MRARSPKGKDAWFYFDIHGFFGPQPAYPNGSPAPFSSEKTESETLSHPG